MKGEKVIADLQGRRFRIDGEWFSISDREADYIKQRLAGDAESLREIWLGLLRELPENVKEFKDLSEEEVTEIVQDTLRLNPSLFPVAPEASAMLGRVAYFSGGAVELEVVFDPRKIVGCDFFTGGGGLGIEALHMAGLFRRLPLNLQRGMLEDFRKENKVWTVQIRKRL